MLTRLWRLMPAVLVIAAPLLSQTTDLQHILERLDRLEQENKQLREEVQALQRQAGMASPESEPPLTERVAVQESRTEELAQAKLGTSQRMPVELTGMVVFNAFHNGAYGGTLQFPVTAQTIPTASNTGATFRQTVIGLKFHGPALPGGGRASGSIYFDFWGGTAAPGNNLFRVRLATLDLTWKNTTITVGQDKPIASPREPTTLAQIGLAPLTGAGNLWDWQPQARIEQRFAFSKTSGLRAQLGIFETAEVYPASGPAALSGTLERQRPGYQGRFVFFGGPEERRIEIAPGFHFSSTHVAGQKVPSRLGTLDWRAQPAQFLEINGAFFRGTNAAGLGGLRQGFTIRPSGIAIPVHTTGGWGQFTVFPAGRLSLHLFGGEERNRATDLLNGSVRRNLIYAGNLLYKLAPNVITAIEVAQIRTSYLNLGLRLNNHYDLALAYLF